MYFKNTFETFYNDIPFYITQGIRIVIKIFIQLCTRHTFLFYYNVKFVANIYIYIYIYIHIYTYIYVHILYIYISIYIYNIIYI